MAIYFKKKADGANGEWRSVIGDCTTKKNCGHSIRLHESPTDHFVQGFFAALYRHCLGISLMKMKQFLLHKFPFGPAITNRQLPFAP